MIALTYNGILSVVSMDTPTVSKNEILIRISKAGICNTDIEIVRGYMPGFSGVLGHEFIGYVEDITNSKLNGKRVTAEINCACETCLMCKSNLHRHCLRRTVIGIDSRNGAFAEYITVPCSNLVLIPDQIPDSTAIFIEPLAAALEITEQVMITENHSVLLIGDGKLAQLIAIVLKKTNCRLTVVGKHEEKLSLLRRMGIQCYLKNAFKPELFDVVVEASGSSESFSWGLQKVKPRGTMILKSTYAGDFPFNPAYIIINEIIVIGSRCGSFTKAIDFLLKYKTDLSYLITNTYPLRQALDAFEEAQKKNSMKIILDMNAKLEKQFPRENI